MSLEELKKIKHENWIQKLDKEYNQKPKKKKKSKKIAIEKEAGKEPEANEFTQIIKETLEKMEARFPQYNINGKGNIWIVKPAGLSRGRGIRCHNNLVEIQDQVSKESTWVIQKYIENPMLILKKKFDIRQWVLVTC